MDSFWGNIFRDQPRKQESVHSILKKIPVFSDLSRRELTLVENILHHREYAEGEIIFHQGDPGVGMYIIISGSAAVLLEPGEHLLAELSDGEFFGELALIDDAPRSAKVVATAPSRMLGFFQSDLLDLIDRKPRLGVKIVMRLVKVVGDRLKKSNGEVQALQREVNALKNGNTIPLKQERHGQGG